MEKEDLELENEELASKLGDLTTQAKKMLLNNESLEEEIQDQQVEYEDRIAELERYTAELESKLAEKNEDNNLTLLQQEHDAAVETIEKLQRDSDITGGQKIETEIDKSPMNIGDETSELRKNEDIISELKSKNEEISNLLRFSHDQNDAAADLIEYLKSDIAKLRKVIVEYETNKTSTNLLTMEAHSDGALDFTQQQALQKGKSFVSQTAPSHIRLCDVAVSSGAVTTLGFASNQLASSSAVLDMTPSSFYAPTESRQNTASLIQQIENLTTENGKLAQRLGNAVADKECKKYFVSIMSSFLNYVSLHSQLYETFQLYFSVALTTLSKLGAKVEELMERNRFLSDPSDAKSQNGRYGARNYSGGRSLHGHHGDRVKNDERGRDPDEVKSTASYPDEMALTTYQTSSGHDDATFCSDMASTIISYEPSKKRLEPEPSFSLNESASVVGGVMEDDGIERKKYGYSGPTDDPNKLLLEDGASIEPRSVKVPGGEYYGSLNSRGQKHGSGKMKYDNGNVYDGEWKNNKRDGKGITHYASGNVYTGKIAFSCFLLLNLLTMCKCMIHTPFDLPLCNRHLESREAAWVWCVSYKENRGYI